MNFKRFLLQTLSVFAFVLVTAAPGTAQYPGSFPPYPSATPTFGTLNPDDVILPDYDPPVDLPTAFATPTPTPIPIVDTSFQICNWAAAVEIGIDPQTGATIYEVTCCSGAGNNCTTIQVNGTDGTLPTVNTSTCVSLPLDTTVSTACILDPNNDYYCANLSVNFFNTCSANGSCSYNNGDVTVSCTVSIFSGALVCSVEANNSGYTISVTITPPVTINGQPLGSCTMGTSGPWPTLPPLSWPTLPPIQQYPCTDPETGQPTTCVGMEFPF